MLTNGSIVDSRIDEIPTYGGASTFALDSSGSAYVFYQDVDEHFSEVTKFACNVGGIWSFSVVPHNIFNISWCEGSMASAPSVDANGRAHVTFLLNGLVKYMNNVGGTWNVYAIGESDRTPYLALDKNDKVHIVYAGSDAAGNRGKIVHATNSDGAWKTETIDAISGEDVVCSTLNVIGLSIDKNDNMHFFYSYQWDERTSETSATTVHKVAHVTNAGGRWSSSNVYTSRIGQGSTGVAADRDGRIHISSWGEEASSYCTDLDGSMMTYLLPPNQLFMHTPSIFFNDDDVYIASDGYSTDSGTHSLRLLKVEKRWPLDSSHQPFNLMAEAGNRNVILSWDAPDQSSIIEYKIYAEDPGTHIFTLVGRTNETEFNDASDRFCNNPFPYGSAGQKTFHLENGQTYRYLVTAVTADGESSPSDEVSAIPCTTPQAPEDFFAFYDGNSVALIWNPPSDDGGAPISAYHVSCQDANGQLLWSQQNGNITIYDTGSWIPGASYLFQVAAVNQVGEGARTSFEYTVPDVPPSPVNALSQKSVISAFHFDNITKKIEFDVSGESGTIGTSMIIIPKGLVADESQISISLDGSLVPYTVRSTDVAYVLTIDYHHSSHTVVVSLQNNGGWVMPLLLSAIAIGIVTMVAVVVLKKRKTP